MKKSMVFLSLILALGIVSLASARISYQAIGKESIVVTETNNPAIFDFVFNNDGSSEEVELYSYVGVGFEPKGKFLLPPGESKQEVKVYPSDDVKERVKGFFRFEYDFITSSVVTTDKLLIKLVSLEDLFLIEPANVRVGDSNLELVIRNTENLTLNDISFSIKSEFFDLDAKESFKPYEIKKFSPAIKESAKKLVAGPYIANINIKMAGAEKETKKIINYLESSGFSVNSKSSGILTRKTIVEKKNEGNLPAVAQIEMKRDILTRLITSYSVSPTRAERSGFFVNYAWEKDTNPGDSFVVESKTNYLLPVVLAALVVLVVFFAKIYSRTNIYLTKRVSYVRTKGGEFALKVKLYARAKNHIDSVQLIDRLPGMTKIYEDYGIKPDKVDESTRRIFWNIGGMNSGEERVFSYIIYSKLKIVGRFELPAATAIYEKDGKTEEAWSNRAFFATETDKTSE